jgi:hypothetical protein
MKATRIHTFFTMLSWAALAPLAGGGLIWAQEQPAAPPQPPSPAGVWRHFGNPTAPQATTPKDPEPIAPADAEGAAQDPAPAAKQPSDAPADPPRGAQPYQLPAELTVKPGSLVTVRVNEMLSSDRNRPGDSFSGALAQPLVVDGIVVAERGQTVYGRVVEVQKATAGAPSHLALELTELSLVDGAQTPVRSQLATQQGGTAPAGAQANTVVGTTVLGAIIGSAVGRGAGAAIGAGTGAAAGAIAVMAARNRPTVVYPETALTFRIDAPVLISTARAPQAFRFVGPEDYNRPVQARLAPRPPVRPGWGPMAYPYPYPYSYPYAYSPYWGPYYGPGVGIVIGRGGYGRWR